MDTERRRTVMGRLDARVGWLPLVFALAALVVGVCWAVSSPPGSSPDEGYHLASIWCPAPLGDSGCTLVRDPQGRTVGVSLPRTLVNSPCFAFDPTASAACQTPLRNTGDVATTQLNTGDYPGIYYDVAHLFVNGDINASVLRVRLVNVLVAVALIGGILLLLDAPDRRMITFALLLSMVPLGAFLIASVNPSSWAITGVTGAWMGCYALWRAPTRRTAVAASAMTVVAAAIAASSRSDAGIYVVLVTGLTALLFGRRLLARPRRLAAPAVGCCLGLASFLTSGQSSSLTATAQQQHRTWLQVLWHNLLELPGFYGGFFGLGWGLGWLDTTQAALTGVGGLCAAAVVLTIGLGTMSPRKGLCLALIVALMVAITMYLLQIQHNFLGENVQPRYLLPLFPLAVAFTVMGRGPGEAVRVDRLRLSLVYAALVAAQSAALYTNLRRYITGLDDHVVSLDTHIEWWWRSGPNPMTVWIAGSLAFAVLAAALFVVQRPAAEAD